MRLICVDDKDTSEPGLLINGKIYKGYLSSGPFRSNDKRWNIDGMPGYEFFERRFKEYKINDNIKIL